MFLLNFTIFLLSEAGDAPWWNYPGLELWKFLNLVLFIAVAIYLHQRFGKPIKKGLEARRESIKRELKQAQEERDAALQKLSEVEARFATLDEELAKIKQRSAVELETQRQQATSNTAVEMEKLRDQARREIENTGKAVRHELKEFGAEESIRLAEELLRKEINAGENARLANRSVAQLRR